MSAQVANRGSYQHPVPPSRNYQATDPLFNPKKTQNEQNLPSSERQQDLTGMIVSLKQKAIERQKQDEQSKCVQMTTDLVELFGSMIIVPALRKSYQGPLKFADWHNELRFLINLSYANHLTIHRKQQINELMLCMEKVAEEKGISKAYWNSLIYLNVTTQPSRENFKKTYFDSDRLQYLERLAINSLSKELSDTVHVLIDAASKHLYHSND